MQYHPAVAQANVPRPGGTLFVRDFSEAFKPGLLDPASGASVFVSEQIFDGLVRLDNKLNVMPQLAEYWSIADDGTKFVFYLREGVRFHDGSKLTAQDVKFSFERLIRAETRSPFREYFIAKVVGAREFVEGRASDVSGFRAPAKNIFEIDWQGPYVSALYLLSMSFCQVLPRELVLSQGKDFFMKPVGTGPFQFDSWIRSPRLDIVGVRLERNGAYFAKKALLDFLEYSPYFTEDDFVKREIDIMPFVSDREAKAGGRILDGGLQNITFLMMSCQIPPLDRPSIRKALAFAIDKESLARAVQDGEFIRRTTNNYIPAKWPGFFPRDSAEEYDPERARQILEENGFLTEKKFPDLVLFLPAPKSELNLRFAGELESELAKAGISLTVSYFKSLRDIKDVRLPFLARIDWGMDFPDPEGIIAPLFRSRGEINLANARYSSQRLDRLLEEAETEPSLSRRNDLFRQMEEVLGDDLPAIPLYASEQRIAVQPYVRNVLIPSLGFSYLDVRNIWLDKKGRQP